MSNMEGTGNKGNEGILTRQTTQRNPELKKQINEINKEANVFGRKPRVQRIPPSINLQKDWEHTYVNVPVDSKTEEIMEKASIPTTSKADLNVPEESDSPITANLKQNMNITDSTQNLIDDKSTENTNDLLIPEIEQDILSPADFHTPNQNLKFFDDSTLLGNDRQDDYAEIEGILNEQSLILARDNNTNNNGRIEIEINGNLINFEPEMANQALKLPLKEVAKLVPEFDGNNITLGEYIE